jgi:hypothetical protein
MRTHLAGTCGSCGSLDSPRNAMALAVESSGADGGRRSHGALQTMRTSTAGVLGSDRVRADGETAGGALRAVDDGERAGLFGVWASIAVVSTVQRRSDPGRGSRHRYCVVSAPLAAMAPGLTPSAQHRRRVVAHRAGRSNPRTASAFRAGPPCAKTRHRGRSVGSAGGVVGGAVAEPLGRRTSRPITACSTAGLQDDRSGREVNFCFGVKGRTRSGHSVRLLPATMIF